MCNRIAVPAAQKIRTKFRDLEVMDIQPSLHSNGYDHEMVPVIINLQQQLVQPARWGFLPENARSPQDMAAYDTLNARSETIFESRLYGEAARSRRCILFVDGFFEFKHYQGKKYPHFIAKEDGTTFTFGGLWSRWQELLTCTIITTPANSLMADIHNEKRRMPFILPQPEWAQWLDVTQPQSAIQDMMLPYPNEDLIAWQVGNTLTKKGADTNVPEVQEAVGPRFSKAPYPLPIALPESPAASSKKSSKRPLPPSPQMDLFGT